MVTKPRFAPHVPCIELVHQGKVRDTYQLEDPSLLLMVATDRISTHDVIHDSVVPRKGEILTAMTVFWEKSVFGNIPTHLGAIGSEIYGYLTKGRSYPAGLHLRAVVVQRLEMVPYELILRARMAGSLWKKYYREGLPNPYGLDLPPGLHLMDRIDPPAFTPTEKSETDDPVSVLDVMAEKANREAVFLVAEAYAQGRDYALSCGMDIIDAKFEVGFDKNGEPCLADEWLTGDCSRFVRSDDIHLGEEPPWMDKEVFRQNAVRQWGGQTKGKPLAFSDEVIATGVRAYREVFEALSGFTLESFQKQL